ncbi:MAG: RNA polymerase sigma factor SigZ [Caldithrix sp.]|nr:RNA polymerase sigma factor SigZ [Caldithrix sp.]
MDFRRIYDEFNKHLLSYISKRVNNQEDARDILQEVFLKIMKNADVIRNEERIKNWIFRITRNSIIDYYRSSQKKLHALNEEELLREVHNDEEESVMELDCCIEGFVLKLPQKYRQIITLSELEGKSQKELAQTLNVPYSSLRTTVQRGRKRIKKMLLDCCRIEWDSRGKILDYHRKKKNCTDHVNNVNC